MTALLSILQQQLQTVKDCQHFYIAFSGGLDSCVLLDAMAVLQSEQQSWSCSAIHVHHGINKGADEWAGFCQRFCADRAIPCEIIYVNAQPTAGESPEALARELRYQALAKWVEPQQALLTAQHQTDQAETLLLQLMRGSGVAGLAAMPAQTPFSKGILCRPFLDVTRAELRQYAEQQQLDWVEDDSNQDCRYDRNYLRHQVIPVIEQRWPSSSRTLSRAARNMAEADYLLQELAAQDLKQVMLTGSRLNLLSLAELSPARQRNLLRHWLKQQGVLMPGEQVLKQIQQQFLLAKDDTQPHVQWSTHELRRYRETLHLMAALPAFDPDQQYIWDLGSALNIDGSGKLQSYIATGEGVALSSLDGNKLQVRFRQGNEKIQPAGKSHHYSLKNLFQQADIPPWVRERTPLLYHQDSLVAVPGLCVAAEFVANEQEPGRKIQWEPIFH